MKGQYKFKSNFLFLVFLVICVFFLNLIFSFFSGYFVKKSIDIKKNINQRDILEIKIENDNLKKEIEIFKNEKEIINILESENKELKRELNFQTENKKSRESFEVIFQKNSNIFSTIIIYDPEEKVKKGDLVFYNKNFLIGEVESRRSNSVKILLYSKKDQKNDFYLKENEDIKMKVKGVGKSSDTILVEAPREIEFEDQKKVFLVYKNNSAYHIGFLKEIIFKPQDTSKKLLFKTFSNSNILDRVWIEKKTEGELETIKIEI